MTALAAAAAMCASGSWYVNRGRHHQDELTALIGLVLIAVGVWVALLWAAT